MPALPDTQKIARSPNLQIPHSDSESRAQFGSIEDGPESLISLWCQLPPFVEEEVGIGLVNTAAYPASQLVKLGQTESVGPVDNQRIDTGHIQA